MKKQPVIAIDGYSSTGKSSISKEIAKRLGIIHMDTGALYRAVTYYALTHCAKDGIIQTLQLIDALDDIHLEFKIEGNDLVLFLNGKDVSSGIRTMAVNHHVSQVAKIPEVRAYLLNTQRAMAEQGGVIMDGRDIGSVVLPNADYKFFLTASIEERINRRYLELKSLGQETDREEVKQNLIQRDKIDSERAVAPLIQAEDAILVDNSDMDKQQTIEKILEYIH